jgi:NAD(P)-dependent dehydrogenase (short-subunit alcohol dehydrogenase family)
VAKNYAPKKVRCNVICPGPIDSRGYNEETRRNFAKQIPIGRLGEIEDISYCSIYLASEESSYVTRSVFFIDGGVTACPSSIVDPLGFL